jgi:GcrA cell cycle regulator
MSWDDKKISRLKELWGKEPASKIAEIIGGISRNAVIGKAFRLNLSSKIKTRSVPSNQNFNENNPSTNSLKQKRVRKSKFASLIIEKDFEPENPKKLEELTDNDCKYPIGHPNEPDFYFCGRSSLKDFSYCKLHLLYSYQSRTKKEETSNGTEDVPEFIEKKITSAQ